MFISFVFLLFTAQTQFSYAVVLIPILISMIGVVFSYKSLSMRKKEHDAAIELVRIESDEKMASKSYVEEEIAKVDIITLNISKDLQDLKDDNIREHEQIRKDIDSKLDLIIKLVSA